MAFRSTRAPDPRYTFEPLGEDHLDLARRWLVEPHVRRWWNDDPDEHDYPEGTIRDWRDAIRGADPTDMFLARMDGRPIGVLQAYRVDAYLEYAAQLGDLPAPAFSLDILIGEPELIGHGHGPRLIAAFLETAFDRYGLDSCVIGPSKRNTAAIRAYEKVGFRYLREYREDDTSDPVHVLQHLWRRDFAARSVKRE